MTKCVLLPDVPQKQLNINIHKTDYENVSKHTVFLRQYGVTKKTLERYIKEKSKSVHWIKVI